MSDEEWKAYAATQAGLAKQAAIEEAARAASVPNPREVLRVSHVKLAAARAHLDELETAGSSMWEVTSAARGRLEEGILPAVVGASAAVSAAAEASRVEAQAALEAGEAARAELDERVRHQRDQVQSFEHKLDTALDRVMSAEVLPELAETAARKRDEFLAVLHKLDYLRGRKIALDMVDWKVLACLDFSLAPAHWPGTALPGDQRHGATQMAALRAALKADPAAVVVPRSPTDERRKGK